MTEFVEFFSRRANQVIRVPRVLPALNKGTVSFTPAELARISFHNTAIAKGLVLARYHGTSAQNVESIDQTGLRPTTGDLPSYWHGVYTGELQTTSGYLGYPPQAAGTIYAVYQLKDVDVVETANMSNDEASNKAKALLATGKSYALEGPQGSGTDLHFIERVIHMKGAGSSTPTNITTITKSLYTVEKVGGNYAGRDNKLESELMARYYAKPYPATTEMIEGMRAAIYKVLSSRDLSPEDRKQHEDLFAHYNLTLATAKSNRLRDTVRSEKDKKLNDEKSDDNDKTSDIKKYATFNQTGNIMISTTNPNPESLREEVREVFEQVAVLLAAMTKALASKHLTLFDYDEVMNLFGQSGLFVHMGQQVREFHSSTTSVSLDVDIITDVIGGVSSMGGAMSVAQKVLNGLGSKIKANVEETHSKKTIAHVLFVLEDLLGLPLVSVSVFKIGEEMQSKIATTNCSRVAKTDVDFTYYQDEFMFVEPKYVTKYAPELDTSKNEAFNKIVADFVSYLDKKTESYDPHAITPEVTAQMAQQFMLHVSAKH